MTMSLFGFANTVVYDTGWSAQARLLPYLEGNSLFNAANLGVFKEDPVNSTVISLTVSAFICPSEVRPEPSVHDYGVSGVINYGMCGGDWFVWGGFNGPAEPIRLRPQPEPSARGVHRRPEPDACSPPR